MPEYLAPGVFVEETSFRAKSIEGVGTSTAAFVGMTARGPTANKNTDPMPPMLTSFSDFERYYGGIDDLQIGGKPTRNFLAQSVAAFFSNGGGRLYVARVLGAGAKAATVDLNTAAANKKAVLDARNPGGAQIANSGGVNFRVVFRLVELATTKKLARKQPPGTMIKTGNTVEFVGVSTIADNDDATVIQSLSIEVWDPAGLVYEANGLGVHARHPRYIKTIMGDKPPLMRDALTNPVKLTLGDQMTEAEVMTALIPTGKERVADLTTGVDGTGGPSTVDVGNALNRLLALEDISIVAGPGLSSFAEAAAHNQLLIGHAETRRSYRIAVLDTPPDQEIQNVVDIKGKIDSTKAALYYPWVRVANPLAATDPLAPSEIDLPPSGHVCGIYARTDIARGVWKAPANETVTGALDLQRAVSFGEQERLNPLGVNCIRALPNRGIRVWGARTISSDPEWKYVNVRRYFLYLESSIDRGTQWAVFEPNGERLWANVRQTISDFLYNEWVNGALLGSSAKEAFFVQCDRSTMTQNDLDNGRLVCLIGVAAIKPAEFVIFKIGQKTADSRG
ncbi:MAG: hypothetical protein RL481_2330 [Pseudomonadota bacterium]|jgi:uncharacterized protein